LISKSSDDGFGNSRMSAMMVLATYGMVVVEPPGFVPCSSSPVLRRIYLEVSTTVDKLSYDASLTAMGALVWKRETSLARVRCYDGFQFPEDL
jgi:hypothetical protein